VSRFAFAPETFLLETPRDFFLFQLLSSIPENRAGAAHHSPHVASHRCAGVAHGVFSLHERVVLQLSSSFDFSAGFNAWPHKLVL
jgi:hypothetical protein